jgi:DHA1 family multidrug resistance protein-like MFS transporter
MRLATEHGTPGRSEPEQTAATRAATAQDGPAPAQGAPLDRGRTVRELLHRPAMWGFIGTTACVEFCRGALFISLLPAYLTDPRAGLGLSVASLGMVISGQYLADTIFKIPAGWLVDRLGPWRVLAPSLALAAVAVYLLPRVHHLALLIALGLMFGLGASANWPAVLSGSVQLGGMRSRASATSITFLAWLAGGGPGPILINFLIGRGYGSAFTLLTLVVSGAPAAALLGLSGALHRPGDPEWKPAPSAESGPRQTVRELAANLRDSAWLIPGMFVQMLALGIVLPVLVPFARQHLHLASQAEYGLMLLAGGAVTVLCLLPMGRVVDRIGSKPPLVAGFGLAAAAVLLLAVGHGGGALLWRVSLLGFSYAMILPAWNGLTVGKIDAERRGLFLGLFMSIEGLGIALGSAAGGTLYTLDYRAPFLATAAILTLVSIFYLLMPRKRFAARQGAEA